MGLFDKALKQIDAYLVNHKPFDPLVVRDALLDGQELERQTAPDPRELVGVYEHLFTHFTVDRRTKKGAESPRACAVLLYTLYAGKGVPVSRHRALDEIREAAPLIDAARDVRGKSLDVYVCWLRHHLQARRWEREDVITAGNYGYSLSPRLQAAVRESLESYEASKLKTRKL